MSDLHANFRRLRLVADDEGRVTADGPLQCHFGDENGIHASWNWDGAQLSVANCVFGFQPLFYQTLPNGIAVAESVRALIDTRPTIDVDAVATFLGLGFFLGDDTPFVGIRQLSPNSRLTWTPHEGARIVEGERPGAAEISIDRATAIRTYAELFQEAVQRRLPVPGRLCVPLSGGRDSRHIALALNQVKVKPHTYITARHLPWRNDEDARVAGVLAEHLGAKHTVIEQPMFIVKNLICALDEMGFCSDEHAWLLPTRDWVDAHADFIFDGIGGDIMSAGLFQKHELHEPFLRGDTEAVADAILGEWSEIGWIEQMLQPDVANCFSAVRAKEHLVRELARHRGHHNPVRSFFFWNRTRREIALVPFLLMRRKRCVTPYLDHDLWRFLDSLPYGIVADHTFHTDTILYAYPDHSMVPFERKGVTRQKRRHESLLVGAEFTAAVVRLWGAQTNKPTVLKRSLRLLMDHHAWWSLPMLLCILMILRHAAPFPASRSEINAS